MKSVGSWSIMGTSGRAWRALGEGKMSLRCLAAVFAVVTLTPMFAAAQSTNTTEPPRTPWGAPDLQGVWDYRTITPLQRSAELVGQEFFTEEEAAEFERANGGSSLPAWSWWEDKLELTDDRRTSLIVDPPDGRIPSLTPEAEARVAAMATVHRRPPEHPEDRTLFERCLVGRASGPPMIPSLLHYDSRVQVFQTPGYVVLFNEMIHETRVVPLDERPHVPPAIRQWLGDSRGHWEGNTLVVETTNFTDQTNYGGWGFGNPPLQQNLWASSGSGSRPSWWYRAVSITSYVLKPRAFLRASLALVFNPSTTPLDISPLARNQLRSSSL